MGEHKKVHHNDAHSLLIFWQVVPNAFVLHF